MFKLLQRTVVIALGLGGPVLSAAQLKPELVERGKKATALVEVSGAQGDTTGSAFCIHKSGLFITCAHVVKGAEEKGARVRLLVDCGQPTQQVLPARVLRQDEEADLALLAVKAKGELTDLELARDARLVALAEVTTFGYPFGQMPAAGRGLGPEVTVVPSRITALPRQKGRVVRIELDNQLNTGNSGGPVLDASGKVVGVAVANQRAGALKLAVPGTRLVEFLRTPGLLFEPPPLPYEDRSKPVTWTIKVQPPTPISKLPDRMSVAVTITDGVGKPRTYTASPAGDGAFTVAVTPLPHDPDWMVLLYIYDISPHKLRQTVLVKNDEITVGGKPFRLSELDRLYGGKSPRIKPRRKEEVTGPIRGLGKAVTFRDKKPATINLDEEIEIQVNYDSRPPSPINHVEALVEVKQGSQVLSALRRAAKLTIATPRMVAAPVARYPSDVLPELADDALLKLGGKLRGDGVPKGAGNSIKPPAIALPPARLTPDATDHPLVLKIDGTISDATAGAAGRFLFLTQRDSRKLVVFDVNTADVIKTIVLPSPHALVAAGASKLLIVFPDERLIQRYSLPTFQRDGSSHPCPIKGRILGVALGADSDGPALALWSEEGPAIKASTPRFSFIDLESLTVSKIGTTSVSGTPLVARVSPSRGTFVTNYSGGSRAHVRAAADGALFGIWNSYVVTDGLWMLKLNWGGALVATAFTDRLGQIAPGPDGQTVYTGSGVRYSASGQRLGKVDSTAAEFSRELLLPSFDPAYYLSIGGLPAKAYDPNWPHRPGGAVTAAVHAARDGSRLFSICGLDEMADPDNKADWYQDDFTPDKRFHLVPAAGMLITIPLSNDRLVLRGLKLRGSVEGAGTDRLVVVSRPDVAAVAGQKLVHQIVARSNKGGITFELARGPEGLAVAPDGTVAWMVPAGQKEGEVTAVVTVGDASGAELFHTLKIHVE